MARKRDLKSLLLEKVDAEHKVSLSTAASELTSDEEDVLAAAKQLESRGLIHLEYSLQRGITFFSHAGLSQKARAKRGLLERLFRKTKKTF